MTHTAADRMLLLTTCLALAACSVNPRRSLDAVQSTVYQQTGQRVHWLNGSPEEAALNDQVQQLLSHELSPDNAVAIALVRNRSVQATLESLGIAEADLVQAGLLKNPVFSIGVEFPGRPHTRVGAGLEAQLLDIILLPLRQKTAAAAFEQAKATLTDKIVQHAAAVRIACIKLEAQQEQLDLLQQRLTAADAGADLAHRLAAAGNIPALDASTHRAHFHEATLALAAAQADLADTREELTTLLGLPAPTFTLPAHLPPLPDGTLDVVSLEAHALAHRLDLLAIQNDVALAGHLLGYAQVDSLLNGGALGIDYTRDPDIKSTLGPSVSIPIPLFDQGQAAVSRAQSQFRQTQNRHAALANDIRSDVRKAAARLTAQRARVHYFDDTLLPLRRDIVQQTLLQYNAMATSPFALLDAKVAELDAQQSATDALRDAWLATLRLEQTIAGPLSAIPAATTAPAPSTAPAAPAPSVHTHP